MGATKKEGTVGTFLVFLAKVRLACIIAVSTIKPAGAESPSLHYKSLLAACIALNFNSMNIHDLRDGGKY